ncbi:MAG: hypothetical protein KKG76_10740 [Euryarchaeota archaeon]|nr:hypothetical protein [Euryarchaeota archaeon]MBU4139654.1 hypothetical protein [Euryarchaeota archaeon]
MKNSTRDVYTNATALFDVEELKRLVDEHSGGWVIVDGVAWYKLRPRMRDFIKNNLTIYIASDKIGAVEVYVGYGRTVAGRYLFIVFVYKLYNTGLIISARDMKIAEILQESARKKGMSVSSLANKLLQKQLAEAV